MPVLVTCLAIGYNAGTGERDFAVSHIKDAAGTDMNVAVVAAYYDHDPSDPTVELMTSWATPPGSPAYVSSSTFRVSGDFSGGSSEYETTTAGGRPVRLVSTARAGQWVYTHLTGTNSYSAPNTTVTVQDAILDSGINTGGAVMDIDSLPTSGGTGYMVNDTLTITTGGTLCKVRVVTVASGVVTTVALLQPGLGYSVGSGKATSGGAGSGCTINILEIGGTLQIASEYVIERGRYQDANGNPLLTIRLFAGDEGAVIALVNNVTLANPATAIKEILSNTVWSLGQTVDATSFATAVTDFANAGLGSAIGGSPLGDGKTQRRAGEVLSEILAMRGARLKYDADLAAWTITVDKLPAAPALTLGYGDGVFNNIKRVARAYRTPLDQAVKTLNLLYGPLGRVTGAGDAGLNFQSGAYRYNATAQVLGVGKEQNLTASFLGTFAAGKLVLAYNAKRLRFGDQRYDVVVGDEGRNVQLGQLVRFIAPLYSVDASFIVARIGRRLHETTLTLAGYDPSTYTFAATDVVAGDNTQADAARLNQRRTPPGAGQNLVVNSDFSAPIRSATVSATMLPGWIVGNPSNISSITITRDLAAIGGYYVTVVVSSVSPQPYLLTTADLASTQIRAQPVQARMNYIASVYGSAPSGWHIIGAWFNNDGTANGNFIPSLRNIPDDKNGLGWSRYCVFATSPPDPAGKQTAYASFELFFDAVGTYKFDAVKFELTNRRSRRPTNYTRDPLWGIDPAQWQTGPATIRRSGDPENGTKHDFVSTTVNTTGGVATIDATNLIPAGCYCLGVTTMNATTVTGCTSYQIGDTVTAALWGTQTQLGANKRTDDTFFAVTWTPLFYSAAKTVRLTAAGGTGTFTGGSVVIVAHVLRLIGPTT